MIRYINMLLKNVKHGNYIILIRGVPRNLRRILKEILIGRRRSKKSRRLSHVNYIVFSNKFEHVMTQRAIKKRLRKNFQKKN
jgi:hypothetical protein